MNQHPFSKTWGGEGQAPLFLLEENHELPLCRLQLTLRSGATADGDWEQPLVGLCDFSSELMRRGAAGRSRAELDEQLDNLGASCHVACGYDSVDFEVVALRDKLDQACQILADVVLRPDYAEDEAERLRRETLAQLDDLRDDDTTLVRRFFSRSLYNGGARPDQLAEAGAHPYGRPVGALPATLPLLTPERARAWHGRHLRTGNLIVAASGDLTEEQVRDIYERHFADLPVGERQDRPVPEPPRLPGVRVLVVDKPERTQTQLQIGHLGPRWDEPHWLPFSVASTAFGGTFTSRLMDEVRVKRGLSYGASARVGSGRGRRSLLVHTYPAAEQTAETLSLVLGLLRSWAAEGLSAAEIHFARGYLRKSHAFRVQTPEARLAQRVELLLCGLPEERLHTYPQRVEAVSVEQVEQAQRDILRPGELLVTMVGTAETLLPQLKQVSELAEAPVTVVAYDSY